MDWVLPGLSIMAPKFGMYLTRDDGAMNDGDKQNLREAAACVEQAESRVLEMIGPPESTTNIEEHISLEELAALRLISSNLRAACTRMWTMADQG
jgi:hypothetical protein